MKTFTEVVEKKLAKMFTEFRDSPQLVGYVTAGIPIAIASNLRAKMLEDPRDEVSIKIGNYMKFILKINKRGDSTAFTPEFELLEKGKEVLNEDSIEYTDKDAELLAHEILDDEDFINACRQALSGKTFDDEKWVEEGKTEKGVVYDEESDVAVCVTTTLLSLIEILTNNKDSSNEVEYDVAGLATFKVSPVKDGYTVTAVFDKAFKNLCKSDKLAEKLSSLETE